MNSIRPRADHAVVRKVSARQPYHWLANGWRDIWRCPTVSLAHGAAVAVFGAVLIIVARDRFWMLAGAFSGFLVVAPVLATGLYALSRALDRGEPADVSLLIRTWTVWGHNRRADPTGYWCLVRFGLLLAIAGTGWVLTSAAFITLFAPVPINNPADFLRYIVAAPDSYVFELWLVLGGVLAAPVFASSVVSMPMLLDRHVKPMEAVLTSWRVVQVNPGPIAIWAGVLMLLTLVGFAAALFGLILVIPLLGHASWHAYRDLVDSTTLPPRLRPDSVGESG
ncbi:MAG: DUF2189 domain-containing protein [Rhodocyclaceae bacterium]|nr:DUF2189 domain-containing protein [Rhodocyclaceae bacterium]